jgi:hypothetical protein
MKSIRSKHSNSTETRTDSGRCRTSMQYAVDVIVNDNGSTTNGNRSS